MFLRFSFRPSLKAILLVFLVLTLTASAGLAQERQDKFLIIHLDGTSSQTFFSELEGGHLPNIATLFEGGQFVKHGVSVFPGETPLVLTRIREGFDNSEGVVGWAYIDSETGRKVNLISVFLKMMAQVSRVSRSQFVMQYPLVNHLAGISLLNIDRLWETHDVLEFYWINSDTIAHLAGKDAQIRSLRKLDFYLGLASQSGQLDGANLVLYADHGGSMDDVSIVHYQDILQELLGDELRFMYYPNIYLQDPAKKLELTQTIGRETPVDLALTRVSLDKIVGCSSLGCFEIIARNKTYQYRFHDKDYFGYGELGYQGEWLTKDEWLRLTKNHTYPGAVPSLYTLLDHPDIGDVVIVLDAPQIPYYVLGPKGHHAGLATSDMLVPLLYKGPAFEEVEPFEEFWLHEAFTRHLPMVDFEAKKGREKHSISLNYPFSGELTLSPAYRFRAGFEFGEDSLKPWLEYDLYSSFLTRVWAGLQYTDSQLGWRLRAEAYLGNVKMSWLKQPGDEGRFGFHWRFHDNAELNVGWGRAGLTVLF